MREQANSGRILIHDKDVVSSFVIKPAACCFPAYNNTDSACHTTRNVALLFLYKVLVEYDAVVAQWIARVPAKLECIVEGVDRIPERAISFPFPVFCDII